MNLSLDLSKGEVHNFEKFFEIFSIHSSYNNKNVSKKFKYRFARAALRRKSS
jgi:hypothetical protein